MKHFFTLLAVLAGTFSLQAQYADMESECSVGKIAAFSRASAQARVSANRGSDTYDIHFYHINLNVSNTSRTLGGDVRFESTITSTALDTFWFELKDFMTIDSVLINGVRRTNIIRLNDVVRVPLTDVIQQGQNISCQVFYGGTPPSGGFFSGVSNSNNVTWTLSEPFSAPDWLPCKQDLWDKIDSVWFFATTNAGTKVGSAGLLTNVVNLPNNKVRYEWKTRYKMAFYLIAFAVANYEEYVNYAYPSRLVGDSVYIQHYIYTGSLAQNKVGLDRTPAMLEHYSDKFILYPFHEEKYGHMQANLGGGMEHQTMSTMGGFSQDLTAHELAHMWFGDHVTCATWSDIWLNEGWASYLEYIYRETISQATADSWMNSAHNSARNAATGSVYVPAGASVNRIFSSNLSYKKGASVLHMLRYVMGDSLFFQASQEYLNLKADTVSTTNEFKAIFEQVSGMNLQSFFDEWIYGEGYPTYNVRWNQIDQTLFVEVTQTTSGNTPAFSIPIPIRFSLAGQGVQNLRVDPTIGVNAFNVTGTIPSIALDPTNIILKGTSTISRNTNLGVSVEALGWSKLKVYPNPNKGRFVVESDRAAKYELRDLRGRLLQNGNIINGTQEIISEGLEAGVYLFQLNDGTTNRTERLVIQ